MEKSEKEKYICCGEVFKTKEELDAHVAMYHCGSCGCCCC